MSRHHIRGGSPSAAFTLVEVLVALVVLAVGVLALASTSLHVMRQMTASAALSTAANLALSRLERLASAGPCATLAGGTGSTGAFHESWTVTPGASVATVSVTVRLPPDGRATTIRSAVRCR